jgi:hypothetical protein
MPAEVEAPSSERGFFSEQDHCKRKSNANLVNTGANATPEQCLEDSVVGNPQFVKPEEVKWSGVMDEIDRLAQENKGKVPVQELLNYLRDEGQVKFEEVTLGGVSKLRTQDEIDQLERQARRTGRWDEYEQAVLEFEDQQLGSDANLTGNQTKHAQYQLDGGTNYREVVLTTAPKKDQPKVVPHPDKNLGGFALQYSDGSYAGGDRPYQWSTKLAATEGVQKYKDEYGDIGFTSSHFPDIPNYIAHMRVNERTDVEGNPGLFVEEFQSDRHQKGREQGYGTQFAVVDLDH